MQGRDTAAAADREIVAAVAAGDPAGLAAAFDAYAAALQAYCRSLLADPAEAADAVTDTFVIAAARLGALADPGRVRPWLYAVARRESQRRLHAGARPAAPADAEELVPAAMAVLRSPDEREVAELTLRHGLNGADLADVLGAPASQANALAARARGELEKALAAEPGLPKQPGTLPLPFPELAPGLREQVLQLATASTPEEARYRGLVAGRAGRFTGSGFPAASSRAGAREPRSQRGLSRPALLGLTAAVIALAAGVGTAIYLVHPRHGSITHRTAAAGPAAGQPGHPGAPARSSPTGSGKSGSGRPASRTSAPSGSAPTGSPESSRPGTSATSPPGSQSRTSAPPGSPPPPPPATSPPPPAPGTLNVSTTNVQLSPVQGQGYYQGTFTITAVGGPVNFTIEEPRPEVDTWWVSVGGPITDPTVLSGSLAAGGSMTIVVQAVPIASSPPDTMSTTLTTNGSPSSETIYCFAPI